MIDQVISVADKEFLTLAQHQQFSKSFPTSPLKEIAADLRQKNPLTLEQATLLFTTNDIHALGFLANAMRHNFHGKTTWYVINKHINYSNLCEEVCLFCSFSRGTLNNDEAYEMDLKLVLEKAEKDVARGITEIHIVGGNNPSLPWGYYTDMLSALHERFPQVGLKCFTAVEIHHFAKRFNKTYHEVLSELKDCGLSCMPGGGAEVFAPRVRNKIARTKATGDEWIEVHRVAHNLDIPTNATMLFGTIERPEEKADHLLRLRDLQDETGGFLTFIPLVYHNENNRLSKLDSPGTFEKLRMIAASRLILSNFPHIKAYWVMMGIPVSTLAQNWGASDIDGTVIEEKIYHMAGAKTPQTLTKDNLIEFIRQEGFEPRERDNLYRDLTCS
jgi:aminodeoxyfutalosine synthase